MRPAEKQRWSPTGPLLELLGARIVTPSGRTLFEGLNLSLSNDQVALIGRNGVGKSTLLSVLAGEIAIPNLRASSKPHFVPQVLSLQPADRSAASALERLDALNTVREVLARECSAAGCDRPRNSCVHCCSVTVNCASYD
jgi:ATPase subunit of ABC transporter with duplicated ATPase domains